MIDISEKENDVSETSNTIKYFKTVCLCFGFLCIGVCIAVLGPTLPTLAYNLQVHISTLSYILPARAAGYLSGSIVSGFVYGKFDSNLLIFISLLITACGTIVIPFFDHVVLIAIACFTIGVSMGFLDTAGNVMCLQTWGEKSRPFVQTLHFSFAIGTTIAPLLASPFIMDVKKNKNDVDGVNISAQNNSSNFTAQSSDNIVAFQRFYEVTYVFVCSAALCWLVSMCFLYITCFHKNIKSYQKNTIEEEGTVFRVKAMALLFVFFLVYVGMEVSFGVYVYTFAIKSGNGYTKSQATALNTIFWSAFAVGRFVSIPVSKFLSSTKLMTFNLAGVLIATITLSLFPLYSKSIDFIFWIAIGLFGFCLSSIFPTGFTWAEEYITVTEKAAMIFVVGAAAGDMTLPFLVGQFIEKTPMFLMYFLVIAASFIVLLFILLKLLVRTKGKRLKNLASFEVLKQQNDDKNLQFELHEQ